MRAQWSSLSILSEGESWFRENRIYGYFDRLIDDGFFEDFQTVVFHGSQAAGYAACAFSVAAPGATVLAILCIDRESHFGHFDYCLSLFVQRVLTSK